jgi:NAD(P)-dependent dehydrogenase (short-subunit alcohol dehydrogenase family)
MATLEIEASLQRNFYLITVNQPCPGPFRTRDTRFSFCRLDATLNDRNALRRWGKSMEFVSQVMEKYGYKKVWLQE